MKRLPTQTFDVLILISPKSQVIVFAFAFVGQISRVRMVNGKEEVR